MNGSLNEDWIKVVAVQRCLNGERGELAAAVACLAVSGLALPPDLKEERGLSDFARIQVVAHLGYRWDAEPR